MPNQTVQLISHQWKKSILVLENIDVETSNLLTHKTESYYYV